MTMRITGRHRRPGRLSTATTNLTRSAAIAATSTGLLAGTAVSASATPEVGQEPVALVQESATAPTESLQLLIDAGLLTDRATTFDTPARAVAAPDDAEGADFGTSGFTAVTRVAEAAPVAEPEAAPAAEPEAAPAAEAPSAAESQAAAAVESRTETSASRDNARTAPATPAPQPAPTPAPQPAPSPEPAPAPGAGGVLDVAAAYTGYPYQWGGASPETGFDCSGYTSFVFAQVGISLPRTAAAQQAAATPVSNPQPGDLVFFGYPAYHMGIYAGNGMMYDSGRPGIPTQYRAVFGGVSGYGRVL